MTVPDGDETVCAACHQRLPASARFCSSCGAPVEAVADAVSRKMVTLLFCDVTGSTALGEQLDPEALRGVMSQYFEAARLAIQRHGGTVEKFVGDAVLAVFGIPEVREDDALRAVRAAAELRESLAALSAELTSSMGIRFAVRIGVNTGFVVAGSARGGGSFATGDAVNTAARLEQAAPPGEVLLGAATWSLVRDAVELETLAPLNAKGKAEPLPAYRLVRVLESLHGRNRRLDVDLVGRHRESDALGNALARTTERCRVDLVTVLGPAGIGKTRLVEHFLAGIQDDVRVLGGRCLSYGRGITFWPLVQMLRQAAGLIGEETPEAREKALLAMMDGASEQRAVVDRLLPLLGLGGEPGTSDETFWAVRTVLQHLAADTPLVVTVDDIHWAEPTLLDLLERLRDEVRDVPLLIICQARPELLEQRPGWANGASNATTLLLEPITGQDTVTLLKGLLGAGVPDLLVVAVEGWAGGNPLFVEEVTSYLVENGVLRRQQDTWVVVGDLTKTPVPPTVTALLAARLDRLPPPERALLERVSVIGLEVTTADATALSTDLSDVPALLGSLSNRDLLRRVPGGRHDMWAFRHVLVREAAYESLSKSVRAEMHERFADRLEGSSADAGGEIHAFVGHHLEQAVRLRRELSIREQSVADLARRATSTLAMAADYALDVDDAPAAADLLHRAVALAPERGAVRRELLSRLVQVDQALALVDEARVAMEQIAALMDQTTSALDRFLFTAQLLNLRMDLAETVDPAELRSAAESAAALARQQHDHRRLTRALNLASLAAQMSCRWGDAAQLSREIQDVGSPFDKRDAQFLLGAEQVFGTRTVNEGLAFFATVRDQPGQALRTRMMMQGGEAALVAAAGRTEHALELVRESTKMARELDPYAVIANAEASAQVHLACGDVEGALVSFTDGIDAARDGGALANVSTLLAGKAVLLLEQGLHDDEARLVIEEAANLTSPYDIASLTLVETGRAILAARAGDHGDAAERASKALALIDTTDEVCEQASMRRWLSEVPRRRGDAAEQRRMLVEARDLYRAKGHLPFLAATERLLSHVTDTGMVP
jgi:class 3 adenylate cyclase/tetratricopeptide (TPR) repeat protein